MKKKDVELKDVFDEHPLTRSGCAHLCVDIQHIFCQDDKKKKLAKFIATDIVDHFNALSIPSFFIWYDHIALRGSGPDFYEVSPKPEQIIRKTEGNAFEDQDISSVLEAHHISHIILSGVNYYACVLLTAFGAVKAGYHVSILTDATNITSDGHKTAKLFNAEKEFALINHTNSKNAFNLLYNCSTTH